MCNPFAVSMMQVRGPGAGGVYLMSNYPFGPLLSVDQEFIRARLSFAGIRRFKVDTAGPLTALLAAAGIDVAVDDVVDVRHADAVELRVVVLEHPGAVLLIPDHRVDVCEGARTRGDGRVSSGGAGQSSQAWRCLWATMGVAPQVIWPTGRCGRVHVVEIQGLCTLISKSDSGRRASDRKEARAVSQPLRCHRK